MSHSSPPTREGVSGERMKKLVPIRKINIYQSDDGKKIEEYAFMHKFSIETDEILDDKGHKTYYLGIAVASTPMGPSELKFPIEAESQEEAFQNY